jgi:FkbH-like protein
MKLIEALEIANVQRPGRTEIRRLFLACGFEPLHLLTFFRAHAKLGSGEAAIDVQTGIYGDLVGNLRRATGESPAGIAIVVEWADLDQRLGLRHLGGWSPSVSSDILASVQAARERLQRSLERAAESCPVALCLPTLPLPPVGFTAGWQASELELALLQQVAGLAAWAAGRARLRVLNPQRLAMLSPPGQRWDVKSDLATGFPYHIHHADTLACLLTKLLESAQPKKGLITDLDDTLWRGILGEVGVQAVSWELAQGSQIHGVYQQFLESLADRGVLIAVASKNDPALVDEAFTRPDLRLRRSQVFPFEVHWGRKSESVRRILNAWNVAGDSVVFVDDSPMELAEVHSAHPDIECVLFPKDDPAAAADMLDRLRDMFGKHRVSDDDRIRSESIRAGHAMRAAADADDASADEFLARAEAEIVFRFQHRSDEPRAFELISKTNQFNLNGRRYAEAAWQSYLAQDNAFMMTASYRDKFGPLGTVIAMLGRYGTDGVRVDAWAMSCRAFARRIEHQCLRRLFSKFQAETITLDFQATTRNGPLREFLSAFEEPKPGFRLSRALFDKKCPHLFHLVSEVPDERYQATPGQMLYVGVSDPA